MIDSGGRSSIDRELIERARHGDDAALEHLLSTLQPLVARRCARFLPCREDAEEAAQDALLSIAARLAEFRGTGSFEGWVTVIASNSARMTYRRLRQRAAERGADRVPEPADPRTTSVVAGTRLDLMEALAELEAIKPQVIEPFVLRDLGALPYDDIAAVIGIPVGQVRDRIYTARQFMRQRLAELLE
jgi:RNA polymerase sigma factor (sigma-70 family)